MNAVTLIGNLGADPEVSNLPSGTIVANFRVAVNEVYGTGDKKKEKTHWIAVKAFGKLADVIEKHLFKGSKVGIHGKLSYEEWEKDGQKKSILKVIADRVDFLSWKTIKSEKEPF